MDAPKLNIATLQTSALGISLLKGYEKCRLTAYDDNGNLPGGIWTIGWGNTVYNIPITTANGRVKKAGDPVIQGDVVTQAQADVELLFDLKSFEAQVKSLIFVPLTQVQFDSLVDFTYNTGGGYHDKNGKYRRYDLWANINAGMAADKLYEYWSKCAITQAGVQLPGLLRRRKSEVTLFQTGVLNFFEK
jgi:lysozyme